MNATQQYLSRYFEEKEIENIQYNIDDKNGYTHYFDTAVLIDRILHTSAAEQNQIATILRKIEWKGGTQKQLNHFMNYLAQAMVLQWANEPMAKVA